MRRCPRLWPKSTVSLGFLPQCGGSRSTAAQTRTWPKRNVKNQENPPIKLRQKIKVCKSINRIECERGNYTEKKGFSNWLHWNSSLFKSKKFTSVQYNNNTIIFHWSLQKQNIYLVAVTGVVIFLRPLQIWRKVNLKSPWTFEFPQ